jgi:hypothetical protein
MMAGPFEISRRTCMRANFTRKFTHFIVGARVRRGEQ